MINTWGKIGKAFVGEENNGIHNVINIFSDINTIVVWEVNINKYTEIEKQEALAYSNGFYIINNNNRLYDTELNVLLSANRSKAILAECLTKFEEQNMIYENIYSNSVEMDMIINNIKQGQFSLSVAV